MKFPFRDERGQALVEMAVTAPLFILMLAGAIELGRVAHYAVEVQNASRAGAAYGGENIGNAGSTTNIQLAAQDDAPDISNLTVTPSFGCVCETYTYSTGTSSFSPASGVASCTSTTITGCTADSGTSAQYVIGYSVVTTSETIAPIFHWAGLGLGPYTVTGYSALRILSN